MAADKKKEQPEEQPEAVEPDAVEPEAVEPEAVEPEAAEAAVEPEAPDAQAPAAPEEEPAREEEPAAEEPAPEEEPAAEAAPADAQAPSAPEAAAPAHPKELRRIARRTHEGEARPPRSSEERAAERTQRRAAKAQTRRNWRVKARTKAKERSAQAPPGESPPVSEPARGSAKVRQGIVISDKPDKTISVRIDMARRHPRYDKVVRSTSTLHVHDERNEAHAGDTVRVVESRPLSRTKRWRLLEVLERAK